MELSVWNTRAPAQQQNAESSNSSAPACRKPQELSVENCDDILCFLVEFGVLVCKQHYTGVVNLSSILDGTKVGMTLVPLGFAEFPDLSSVDLDRIKN